MSLVTRQGKGSRLTVEEMDGNLTYLESISNPYKVYTAYLMQEGANDPIATVLQNTLGVDLTWTRDDSGLYYATRSEGEFVIETFFAQAQLSHYCDPYTVYVDIKDAQLDTIILSTYSSSGIQEDLAGKLFIEIRVYN